MALSEAEIRELSRNLPHRSGVYLMEDAKAKVVYIGKAKDLNKRVMSYFQEGRPRDPKTRNLVRRVARVDFLVLGSEKEALITEAVLIKRHRPRYNVQLRDDKAYPLIRLSLAEEWPRLSIVRRVGRDGHAYFGPYVSAKAARQTLKLMNDLFPIRKCRGKKPDVRTRPCLHHQLGHCLAPCTRPVDKAEYQAWVERARLFLKGRFQEIARQLERDMWRASEAERFEEAAALRDKLAAVKTTLERQVVVSTRPVDRDVFGFAVGPTGTSVAVLFIRRGALVGSRNFFLRGVLQLDSAVVAQSIGQFYTGKSVLPDQVLLPQPADDMELLAEWLSEVKGAGVKLIVPRRGEMRILVARAQANAEGALASLAGSPEALANQGLAELGKKLGLAEPPVSLECYDISVHAGEHPVGAMVRFEDGRPVKSKYRNYKIKTVSGQDDTAMLAEVIKRRFAARAKGLEPPDLVVIDGGKGQLNAARAALTELGLGDQPVISLAKTPGEVDADRVFAPGRKNPVPLSRPARLLLMNLRDEAHRRAVTALRKSRRRKATRSKLTDIPGVGPARARALLKTLGSLKAVSQAEVEELAATPGVSRSLARTIHRHFHPDREEGR